MTPPPRPAFHSLRVAAVEPVCADAVAVTFAVPPPLAGVFAFAPGQFLTLRRWVDGREERRSYSVCSPAGGPPRIGVRAVPGGLFSTWLVTGVRPGDRVDVLPPAGRFTPGPGVWAGHHVLIAAGSGITPLLSLAGSLLAAGPTARITLLYGNRGSGTVMFADELADLKDRFPARLHLVHVLSREPREAGWPSGRLDGDRLAALIAALVDAPAAAHWWLCGPHGLITTARQLLGTLGVPAARVRHELFSAEPGRPPGPAPGPAGGGPAPGRGSRITLVLDGRTSTFTLSRDETLLSGVQRARPDAPFACRAGVCGTCRARLSEGRVEAGRDFALEPAERAAGYVLTCQSHPASAALTVDFDA